MNRICQAEAKWGSSINEESEEESSEAQLGGGPGVHPPLAPERGAPPPLQNEKKERMAKISMTGIRKPLEFL